MIAARCRDSRFHSTKAPAFLDPPWPFGCMAGGGMSGKRKLEEDDATGTQ
jgi:hypothetical protein